MTADELSGTLDQLASTPAFLAENIASVGLQSLGTHISGIEFSLREQFCHLRDVELEGYLVRVVRIIAEALPALTDLDGTRLAAERHYEQQDAELALSDFTALRAIVIAKLRVVPAEAWVRTGRFSGEPVFNLSELVAMMRSHDSQHFDKISALMEAAAGTANRC